MTLLTKPHLKIFIFLLMVTLLGPVFASSKPFVVPEIKEWKSGNGDFTINQDTRIVYNANHDEVKAIANLLSQDIAQMFGFTPSVVRGKAKAGDIVLNLSSTKYRYEEEYKMVISNQLVITAPKISDSCGLPGRCCSWRSKTRNEACSTVPFTTIPTILFVALCSIAVVNSCL